MKDINLTIFNTDLNSFSRKYLFKSNRLTPYEELLFPLKYLQILASLFEQFLLFEKISFKVYGENAPLAILINELGIKQVEELIEEKKLEFVLWTTMVTYNVDEIKGVLPLQHGTLTSPVHSDPEESIRLGLNMLKKYPDRKIRRMIQQIFQNIYKIPDKYFSRDAAKLVINAYNSNKLEDIGMPNEKDIQKLLVKERGLGSGLAMLQLLEEIGDGFLFFE